MDRSELLPCPFCGNEANMDSCQTGCYSPECQSCNIQLMDGPVGIGWYATESEAAAAWNTRAAPPPPAEQASGGYVASRLDEATYQKIEAALDRAEAPARDASGRWLSLTERVAALSQRPVVSDEMVERAEAAATEYWQDESHATRCDKCNGTGEDRSVPDWCGACGGQGHYHAGTESGAMRAALTAALAPQQPTGEEG